MGRVGEARVPTQRSCGNTWPWVRWGPVEWCEMDESFSNDPIPVEQLPRLVDDAFVSVDRRYVWGTLAGVAAAIIVAVVVAVLIVWRTGALVVPVSVAAGVVVVFAAVGVVVVVESRRLAYQLRERDLSLRSGAFRHRVETIPFSRIQHVGVGRGLLERTLGLATLQVSSAGPDFSVPGLAPADAERIKAAIAERAADESERQSDDVPELPPPPDRNGSGESVPDATGPAPWPAP